MSKKEIKSVAVNKSLTEQDLLAQMGQCSSTSLLPGANVHLSKERFGEIIKRYKTLEDVKKYMLDLESRSYSFEALGKEMKKAANDYGKTVPGHNFIFHGGLIDLELEKSTFISNLSENTANDLAVLLFRNCQMSPLFCDVIVAVYMLCKKAGIDKGDFMPKK